MIQTKSSVAVRRAAALLCAIILLLGFLVFPQTAQAAALENVSISIDLDDYGNARVTEERNLIGSAKSGWHIVKRHMGDVTIRDLVVQGPDGQPYETVEDWDAAVSEGNVMDKAALLRMDDDSYEIYWGAAAEEYSGAYTVSYTIENLVRAYDDLTGFASVLLSSQESIPTQMFNIRLHKDGVDLTPENCPAWAVGAMDEELFYADGDILLENVLMMERDGDILFFCAFLDEDIFPQLSRAQGNLADATVERLEAIGIPVNGDGNEESPEPDPNFVPEDVRIPRVDIDVRLDENGYAHVTETRESWVGSSISYLGHTEWYIVMENMGPRVFTDLRVIDETGREFQNIGKWDVDADFQDKAYKCGIVKDGQRYELCWGMSEVGVHTYTLSYTIENFVLDYKDADGFNHTFIENYDSAPVDVFSLRIHRDGQAFDESNSRIWGFGNVSGDVVFEDGAIVVADARMGASGKATVLVEFEKGLFSPPEDAQMGGSFESVISTAMKGSTHSYTSRNPFIAFFQYLGRFFAGLFSVLLGLLPLLFFGAFAYIMVLAGYQSGKGKNYTTYKKRYGYKGLKGRKNLDALDYSRDIPFGGNIPASAWAVREIAKAPDAGAVICAYLLKWIGEGNVRSQGASPLAQDEANPKKGLNNNSEIELLRHPPETADESERKLYALLASAAGEDGLLQEKELEKWAKKNYSKVSKWYDGVFSEGEKLLKRQGLAEEDREKPRRKNVLLTDTGFQQALAAMGFKKYLQDFTLIHERRPVEVHMWREYLVFAGLFGIADEVSQEFQAIYPAYFTDPDIAGDGYNHFNSYVSIRMASSLSHSMHTGMNRGISASGGGSSSGGGGGFSGGGGGGSSGGGGGGAR